MLNIQNRFIFINISGDINQLWFHDFVQNSDAINGCVLLLSIAMENIRNTSSTSLHNLTPVTKDFHGRFYELPEYYEKVEP